MSLFEDIKRFVSKWIRNPVVVVAVAYIIYKTLSNYVKSESIGKEKVKKVQQVGSDEVIYDEDTKMYIRINNNVVVETSNKLIRIEED